MDFRVFIVYEIPAFDEGWISLAPGLSRGVWIASPYDGRVRCGWADDFTTALRRCGLPAHHRGSEPRIQGIHGYKGVTRTRKSATKSLHLLHLKCLSSFPGCMHSGDRPDRQT